MPAGEVALAGSGSSHQGPLLLDDHGPPPVGSTPPAAAAYPSVAAVTLHNPH